MSKKSEDLGDELAFTILKPIEGFKPANEDEKSSFGALLK